MPSNTVDLSICLVNHNAKELAADCIRSIYEKTKLISFEIILVDNNSTDGSQKLIENSFPKVEVLENKQNRGFASANNQAMSIAKGKYIILLNNDTVLKNDALSLMVNFMKDRPDVGALTCKLYDADGKTIQRNCRAFPTLFGTMFGRASLLTKLFPNNPFSRKNTLTDWDYDSLREVDWVSGAVLLTRREVINKIGGLDEKFFMFWEDTDYCKRVRDVGWKIMFIPEAEIIHFTGKGGGKRSLLLKLYTMFEMHRSAYYYFRKHYYKSFLHPMALLTFVGMIVLVAFKAIIEILTIGIKVEKSKK